MRFSTINTLVEGLAKEVSEEKKNTKVLSTKEKALRKALKESKQAIDRNNHRGGRKIADYRRSFEELLESYYPGKPWYKITSINIDDEFANGCTPEQVITKIVENINRPKQKKSQRLNESVKLKEGSRAAKAKAVLNKLIGDSRDDGMYEDLNYDDFGDEQPWEQDERISFSDLDTVDESCVKEGARADKAKAALKRFLHEDTESYNFKSQEEAKRYWIDNFWNSKYGIEEYPSFQDFLKVCTINESLCEDDDLDIEIDDDGEIDDVEVDGEEIEDIPEPEEVEDAPIDSEEPVEEEPVEEVPENPVAEKIEEIKELIQEIEDEFDDEIWDDEVAEEDDIPEPTEDDIVPVDDEETDEIGDGVEEEPVEDEPIEEGVRADKAKAVLKGFMRGK